MSETESPSTSAPPGEETESAEASEDSGIPAWVWWLLAALALLGAVLAMILIPRARRRREWDEELAAAEAEVGWLGRELLPQMQQAGSPDEVAGGWQVAGGRVTAVEDRLTALASTAPDEARGGRAQVLRDAVREVRQNMQGLLVSRDATTLHRELAAIQSRLSAALEPPASTS